MDSSNIAPRFSLKLPMRYRPVGDAQWRESLTENVSSSGARFMANEPLTPGRKIEIEIIMTAALLRPARVVAVSEVIRQGVGHEPMMTAVHHLKYEMKSEVAAS